MLSVGSLANGLLGQVGELVRSMRVRQWTKNLLVLAALLFSSGQATQAQVYHNLFAFVLFCLCSSAVYLLNDFVDRESDRLHPQKCNRPMAAGTLNPYLGLAVSLGLLATTLFYGFSLSSAFGLVLMAYFANSALYSLRIKHIVLLDIMSIASGFVLRAVGGGIAINVSMTPWFLLCTLLLALFLAIGKRRYELGLLDGARLEHRRVLRKYSVQLLDQLTSIVTTCTIMCYALYTFTSGKPEALMATIPLVIYGIFRYLYLIHIENKGGRPEKILLGDKHILLTVAVYSLIVLVILH